MHIGNFVEVKAQHARRAAPRPTTSPTSATPTVGARRERRRRHDHRATTTARTSTAR
ncbi:MAG: hypothetical protein MZW92_50670 [Comamonadaceae bacterium]|nr:hypothetical protein [Comamonadaceae bacterium]